MQPSPAIIQESVEHLKEWIEKESHLPSVEDEDWLETFFYNNKFSLEKTKAKLAAYYSLKYEHPEIMKNRDPISPSMQRAREALLICVAPQVTDEGFTLTYGKIGPDPEQFDLNDVLKRTCMFSDAIHLEKGRLIKYIAVVDCEHLSYKHILKTVPNISQILSLVDAYTERIQVVHFISAPPFLHKTLEMVKRYIPAKLSDRLYVHTTGSESLPNSVDRKILASDYGGDGPSLSEMDEQCQKSLERHRKWFLEQDKMCADGFRWRAEDMKGSFRRLEVD